MMKILRTSAAGAVFAMMAVASSANAAQTATATATADVVAAFTVTKSSDLDFGAIVVDSAGGTVTVSPAGAVTCGSALVCHGQTSAAAFQVNGGTSGKRMLITLPDTSVAPLKMLHASHPGGSAPNFEIELNNFSTNITTVTAAGKPFVLAAATAVPFSVGASAVFGGAEQQGTYTASFSVVVDYE